MDLQFDMPWLSSNVFKAIAATIVLSPMLLTLFMPAAAYNKNNIARVEKSWLQVWLEWDHPPRLALDRYIQRGYLNYIKAMGKPFVITMCGMETTVLPPKYLPLLKGEDREELSLCQGFENMFNMTATTGRVGRHDHVEIDVVAKYINPRLTQFFPHMVAQTDYAFSLELCKADDWKSFNTFELGAQLMFHLTARVLVGEELCRNQKYIDSIIQYSKSFLMSGFGWPVRPVGPFRNWAYWFFTWGLRRDIDRCFSFLVPLIDKRVKEKNYPSESPKEAPMDMIQGLLEMDIPSPEERATLRHAHRILHITFAASAVSSALILHTLHQTLTTPEYLPELRQEISQCLKEHGGWTEQALLHMHFLESYIREMLRMCPPSVLTGQRTILARILPFDNQLALPAGSRISFPALQIQNDPDNYDDPTRFDPHRFMTSKTDQDCETLSASRINEKYLAFGYGKQACPGRFIAVRQVKLVFAKLFHGYDMRWAGKPPKKITKMVVEGQIFPDITTRVSFRKRADT